MHGKVAAMHTEHEEEDRQKEEEFRQACTCAHTYAHTRARARARTHARFGRQLEDAMRHEASRDALQEKFPQALDLLDSIERSYRKLHADISTQAQLYIESIDAEAKSWDEIVDTTVGVTPVIDEDVELPPTAADGEEAVTATEDVTHVTFEPTEESSFTKAHKFEIRYHAKFIPCGEETMKLAEEDAIEQARLEEERKAQEDAAAAAESERAALLQNETTEDKEAREAKEEADAKDKADNPEPEDMTVAPFRVPKMSDGTPCIVAEEVPIELLLLARVSMRRAALVFNANSYHTLTHPIQ